MVVDGLSRKFNIRLPTDLANKTNGSVPLLVDLHGLTGAIETNAFHGWQAKQGAEGFLLVQPQGVGTPGGWPNAGSSGWFVAEGVCCGAAQRDQVDDVAFLRRLVEKTLQDHPQADKNRVYFSGHSNGCGMAYRMAAEASDLVTAVACTSFYQGVATTDDYVPLPMMEVHGQKDTIIPYVLPWYLIVPPLYVVGAEDNAKKVADANKCSTAADDAEARKVETGEGYTVTSYTKGCQNNAVVKLLTIPEGPQSGHNPFASASLAAGEAPIPVTDLAWDFLVQYGTRGGSTSTVSDSEDPGTVQGSDSAPTGSETSEGTAIGTIPVPAGSNEDGSDPPSAGASSSDKEGSSDGPSVEDSASTRARLATVPVA